MFNVSTESKGSLSNNMLHLSILSTMLVLHACFLNIFEATLLVIAFEFFILQDDSRRLASTLFPSLTSMLSRKKDHGTCLVLLYI